MNKSFAVLFATGALFLCSATAGWAQGSNFGAVAYLSWSPSDTTMTDTTPAATNNLYVILQRDAGLSFGGAEIDITWDPAGDGAGCYDHLGQIYKTSAAGTCTYLNRGSAVAVITEDTPTHFHVAWALPTPNTDNCTFGAIIQIQYETDTCTGDASGCFKLNSIKVVDSQAREDVLTVAGALATINGGGTHCAPLPVQPSTWGRIKDLYRK